MGNRILLVDDFEGTLLSAKNFLENEGYGIDICANGEEALNILNKKESGIDLIITDIKMPKIDGIELIDRVRKSDKLKSIPVLIMTLEVHRKEDAKKVGANGWITKPLSKTTLLSLIKNFIK